MSFVEGLEVEDNVDLNFAYNWNALYFAIRGNLVISGCEVSPNSPADLKVDVSGGYLWCAKAKRTVALVDDLDLTALQGALTSGQSRFIFVVWDASAGAITTIDGTAGATGNIYPPAFDDSDKVLLALITLTYGDTQIDASDIEAVGLKTPEGGFFDGAIEVDGAATISGNTSIGGTLAVTGLATFSNDITLADAKDLKFTKGAYKASLEAATLAGNIALTLPATAGKLGLVSDGNYHVFSETEVKASYAADLSYSAGTLKVKNANGAAIGTGINLNSYYYAESEIDTLLAAKATKISVLGDSTTNILTMEAIFEVSSAMPQITFGDNSWGTIEALLNNYSTNLYPHLKYNIPLAPKRDGKELYIKSITVNAHGDSNNRIVRTSLMGTSLTVPGGQYELAYDATVIGDTGEEAETLTINYNASSRNGLWVKLNLSSDNVIKIYGILIHYYYV